MDRLLLLVAAGLITRFGNQPINAVIMTWGAVPPDGWQMIRDTWWNWHLARLAAGIAGGTAAHRGDLHAPGLVWSRVRSD